jgi:amino acid transporter
MARRRRSPSTRRSPLAPAWRRLVGRPLRAREASSEEITPVEGLSALSLDALTSVAYGPEAILVVLAAAGTTALGLVLPITVAIVVLLAILVVSYRQVIDAYPSGGGAYAVSRANLGARVSLVAAAALVVDYTLTVAVSIAAGVGSLTSAFPALAGSTVPLCLAILAVVTVLNLRGLGEAARAFLLPTMVFIVGLLSVIAVGLVHPLGRGEPPRGHPLVATQGLEAIGVVLVLKAFAAGLTALTGVEAIANGVPLFRPPRAKRAKRTELLLGVILGAMLVGLAVLARRFAIEPRSGQTVLSQVMAVAVGRQWAYYVMSVVITVVLGLAANTSFGGLPVLASLLSRDNHLPHLFALRGDRQVFANGIWALAILAAALLIAVDGNTNSLIPLFAVGVFTGFTLAQAGLVVHWWRTRPGGWRRRAVINAGGAVVTGISTGVLLVTKFAEGAWVVAVAVPAFVLLFIRIGAYYERAGRALRLGEIPARPRPRGSTVIVPVVSLSRLTRHAISEALSISDQVEAVTVVTADEPGGEERIRELQQAWERWSCGVPLTVLRTEYASVAGPVVRHIDRLRRRHHDQIVVLIPVAVPRQLRYRLLHNHLDLVLSAALRTRTDVVVARVPLEFDAGET